MKSKLTIAIPIYNGEYTISDTLDSIIPQIIESGLVEILICDNCSTDNTRIICQRYVNNFELISYNLNSTNLGFDGNIARLIELSSTDYIWFMGDDDELDSGAIRYILGLLNMETIYSGIFVNYSLIDRLSNKIICKRVVDMSKDIEFNDSNSFLNELGLAPNFLSSVIINKKFYNANEMYIFQGYQFFHFMVLYGIIGSGKSYFVSYPYVLNKGIEVNGPNSANAGGVSILIFLDLLDYIKNLNPNEFSQRVKRKIINQSFDFFYRKVPSARMYGAKIEIKILKRLFKHYSHKPQLYFIIIPMYFVPGFFYKLIYRLNKFLIKIK
jgi:glycosyltransferase involved in cell wall biosynthesis